MRSCCCFSASSVSERVLVRQPPGQELVGAHAERVDVRGRPGLLAVGLLGRQVGRGAEHRADLRDARLLGRLGDPEVGELRGAAPRPRSGGCPASRRGGRRRRGARSRARGRRRARSPRSRSMLEQLVLAQQVGARRAVDVLHDDVVAVGSRGPGPSRRPGRCSGAGAGRPPAPRAGSGPRRPRRRPGARPAASRPPRARAPCRSPGRPWTCRPRRAGARCR